MADALIQVFRTDTPNNPPPNGFLQPGELGLEMATPTRLWAGVPTALVASGKVQLTGLTDPSVASITLSQSNPRIRFEETDRTDPSGRWQMSINTDVWGLYKATLANFGAFESVIAANATTKTVSIPIYQLILSDTMASNVAGNHLRLKQDATTGGIAVLVRSDSTYFYVMLTDSGNADGNFNALRPLYINKTTGMLAGQNGQTFLGGMTISDGVTINNSGGGIAFETSLPSTPTDVSKHLQLHPSGYGISITGGKMNLVVPAASSSFDFYCVTSKLMTLSPAAVGTDGVMMQVFGHIMIPTTGALEFGAVDDRFQRLVGGQFSFYAAATTIARVDLAGTSLPQTYSIVTREKGDNRYALSSSSLRFKDDATPVADSPIDTSALKIWRWTWGGELMEDDPRRGKQGFGFIAEEVEAVLPEAVVYNDQGKISGLDALSMVAVLYDRILALEAAQKEI